MPALFFCYDAKARRNASSLAALNLFATEVSAAMPSNPWNAPGTTMSSVDTPTSISRFAYSMSSSDGFGEVL